MIDQQIEISTKDGKTTTFITHPERGGPFPIIIFYMDAPAIREELRDMARRMTAAGVRIEIEAFDTGHLWLAKQLHSEGVIPDPVLVQLCMGVPWGAPDDLNTFMAMVNNVPAGWHFSAFGLGRNEMAYVAAATIAGGNVRVGLEDNLWLEKGVLATNAQLVERAATIIENLGARVITPAEVRAKLKLEKRAPVAK